MNEQPKKRWGCLQWGVVGVVVVLGVLLLSSEFTHTAKVSVQMKAVSNAKQIIIALKQYAGQNGSAYPRGFEMGAIPEHTSNRMFRELFVEQIVSDERIFASPGSPFVPDQKIGEAPLFSQALEPGENHWMMLRDQTDTSFGNTPLLIENALNTTWLPRWDTAVSEPPRRGRAWKNGMIVIACNDGSVQLCKLLRDGTLDLSSPEGRNLRGWANYFSKEKKPLPEFAPVE